MKISVDGTKAEKQNPAVHPTDCIVYTEKPVQGRVEFEIEPDLEKECKGITNYIAIGIMLHNPNEQFDHSKVPYYTAVASNHCVWYGKTLCNNIIDTAMPYGTKSLYDLKEGDKVGVLLTSNGELHFLINGQHQGRAASHIYKRGWDVYIIVAHHDKCKATQITKAGKL